MRRFIKEYFCFNRGERNGTIVLSTIMVLVFVFPWFYNLLRKSVIYHPDHEFFTEVTAFYNKPGNKLYYANDLHKPGDLYKPGRPADSSFRSAALSGQDSINLEKIVDSTIMIHHSYDDSGEIADKFILKTDVNTADTSELMQIRGIGPVLSRRIIRYRDILGGYYKLPQLKEVYGIDEERYLDIHYFIYADTTRLIKLGLLSDEFSQLLRHPYLDYEQVSQIFRLRNSGSLNSPDDLFQSPAFSTEDMNRLLPYLVFD